ncbi:MAG: type II toxin-antitoxin system RelE/ParE family toxin [Candidatus Diapherotrites archaeon]|nr:type II toxin-antitoxin system RelE/ParE family toxin [Candidatus Diapherotrites archaeon]
MTERLKRLADDPVPPDSKFITRDNGEPVYRFRIGGYRALYKVKHAGKIVLVTKIDKRPRVYD